MPENLPELRIVKSRLSPASWERRVEAARLAVDALAPVLAEIDAGSSLNKAIASKLPASRRSWALRSLPRFRAYGVEGLIDRRLPREASMTEDVRMAMADAIADARVMIEDAVKTPLDQKGTGVRGAMLLLLLSFIAESSKSAVVFGIEEPEAFLHPEAHRELGAGLERFTQRSDVSMLVTTHSPFLFRSGNEVAVGRSSW